MWSSFNQFSGALLYEHYNIQATGPGPDQVLGPGPEMTRTGTNPGPKIFSVYFLAKKNM